jgi:2-amino-4-hydroxy-6-hydroxymethyldihydropteridine diphosphokinase
MIREQRMRADYVAVLSLGSNLGDREALIRSAVHEIAELPGVVVVKASSLIETPALRPEGVQMDAPAFLNAAVMVRTTLEPHDLLAALNRIEDAHGRVRSQPWGDRTLDIDIISCGALRIDSTGLTVPHPRAAQRAFVLAPWLEIDPGATLPGIGRVDELLLATGQHVSPYPAEPLL